MPDLKNLVQFFIFVMPGFIALGVYRSIHPFRLKEASLFFAWSVVHSVWIYTFYIWLCKKADPTFSPSLAENNVSEKAGVVLGLIVAGVLVGLAFAGYRTLRIKLYNTLSWQKHSWLKKILAPLDTRLLRFVTTENDKERNWVVVFLKDKSVYMGGIRCDTYDPEVESQEILLTNARRVDENLNVKYEIKGLGVYLETENIKRIEFIKTS